MPKAKTYPLDIRNVGDDTYVVMSKGHHDPHAFMAAVRAAGYGDWPLGVPRLVWLKTTPCAPSCGEHHCHYQLSDEQRKGWTPATYAHEAPQDECYKPPADAGVTTVAPAPRSDRATCPAHGGDYHWTLDCPECVKDAQARGMSIDTYYSRVRPTLRPAGVSGMGDQTFPHDTPMGGNTK